MNLFLIVNTIFLSSWTSDIIEKTYRSKGCQDLQIPDWLSSETQTQLTQINERLAEIEKRIRETHRALEEKRTDSAVAAALADIDLLDWFLKQATRVASVGSLCHITGWTTAEYAESLQATLDNADIHGVIRFATPPRLSKAPVNMTQPWWAKPFLFIMQMLGTPDSTEIDSSKLLPFIVPVLFGYIFPDVGHGLILALFSTVLYRRWPAVRLLVPCGLSAMLFGLVFGEMFGLEHVIDPIRIRPLEHPLEVLLAPLVFGSGLIQLGLVFNAVEALWRGEGRAWLLREAAAMVLTLQSW